MREISRSEALAAVVEPNASPSCRHRAPARLKAAAMPPTPWRVGLAGRTAPG